jgi:hypothetical protein
MKRQIGDIAWAAPSALSQRLRGTIAVSLSNIFDPFSPIPVVWLADF